MNKNLGLWLLLLPISLLAQPRDPFRPLPSPDCATPAQSPASWQLKGTIGQETLRYAWIVTPAGQWLRAKPRQTLLAGRWQVEQILERQLTLKEALGDPACPAAENRVVLTLGKHKEEK
ncbi:DNA utilization family protein [Serratia liquefaciens]|uniref:DNA utilization family protein n=1 Tax=Serratia liquefaciens TaxID=614 RepID=UPI0004AC1B96|nr:DNA utilization family protein [Serratia liquefaciens]GAK29628.1 hypothetical protein SLIQ_23375 [Serratia liquefaciens FK01]